MSANFNPSNSLGAFLIQNEFFSSDPQQFLLQITKLYADIARLLNVRQIGIFDTTEVMNGEQWFNPITVANPAPTVGQNVVKRFGFRQVYNPIAPTVPLAPGATATIPHGITGFAAGALTFTHLYGTTITNVPDQRPIPYSSVTAVTAQIELKADSTNIYVINGATSPTLNSLIIVAEYLKN